MTYTRYIGALSALALTLVLGACSTPEDLTTPTLEPQFGSADEDIGLDVASVSTGRIYSLSEQSGTLYEQDSSGTSYENGYYTKSLLRRYDSSGKLIWTTEVTSEDCTYNMLQWEDCSDPTASTVEADTQGNVYAKVSYSGVGGDCVNYFGTYVRKFDATGNSQNSVYLDSTGGSFGEEYSKSTAFTVDGAGNIYAALEKSSVDSEECTSSDRINTVSKYSTNGSLLWQRTSTVGNPTDITVSSSGSVYVVGTKGLARYSSSGGLSWTKTGNFEEVVVSGSNLYTRYRKDVRKYDGNGKQLWLKSQSGLNTMVLQAMDGDGSGNVYLSGKYSVTSTNRDAFTRKLNSSGSVLWTKSFGTSAYDDALGIATITGSEIYTTGSTQGTLSHTNIGGSDGYLRKTNSRGDRVWTR